jgi:membrane-associated phospholipid phosphatase
VSADPLRRLLEAFSAAFVVWGLYIACAARVASAAPPFATPIDRAIPFLPQTVWFYVPVYIVSFFLVIWVVEDRRAWRATVLAFLAQAFLAWPFFLLYPVAGPRPAAPLDASLSSAFVRWLYDFDPNYNTFPSLHVANATCCALVVSACNRRTGAVAWVMAACVWVSVLTLKQHWLVDVVGGWLLAAAGWWAARAYSARTGVQKNAPTG